MWLADRLGRWSLQKLTQKRSQQKAATTAAKRKCNPGTDLKVRHYKNNPKKKHIDRGWILEMDDSRDWTSIQRGAVLRDSLFRELLRKTSER
jgi:hypothetical protein